ncbi:MAG: fatty acid desaturase [Bdellovibrionales bacterium]|nr:fatty acid desaturase [Bdellovibrionales bacterium]
MEGLEQVQADKKSLLLVVTPYFLGLPLLTVLHARGEIGSFPAILLATLLMNLSFTAWHEAAHGTLWRSARLNALVGILASLLSLYPGWFARRREHLAHHRYEGDPERDPVWARVQTGFWGFLPRLALLLLRRHDPIPPDFLPITRAQRRIDRITVAGALMAMAAMAESGLTESALFVWVLPRAAVFVLHAVWICWLPHAVANPPGFQVYRVRDDGVLGRFFLLGQDLHGIHHRWPEVPWHRYGAMTGAFRREAP